jgi:hypothetical protein
MQQVGFDDKQSVFMSLVGGGSLLLGTIPAILYMEKFGRRFWACAMLPGFFIGLLIIGCSYLIPFSNKAGSQGTYIAGLIVYEGFFGSYSCLTWVIPSEVYPTYLRCYPFSMLVPRHLLLRSNARSDVSNWPYSWVLWRDRSCWLVLPDPLHA